MYRVISTALNTVEDKVLILIITGVTYIILTDYAIVVKNSPGENRTHSNPKVQVLQTRPPTLTAY